MRIATFNVNGIAARLPRLLEWLESRKPDVACLQEVKCIDERFPVADIWTIGGEFRYQAGEGETGGAAARFAQGADKIDLGGFTSKSTRAWFGLQAGYAESTASASIGDLRGNGDQFGIVASTPTQSVFGVLDRAIAGLQTTGRTPSQIAQATSENRPFTNVCV